jgi:phosphatidylinositol-3,4,5-trisphosphate 3-phosphatase/dual-specificity protein phosphatase PTEN
MKPASSILLDRSREFRLKLHVASVPLGWIWLIPAFHLPEVSKPLHSPRTHTLTFPRSQVDFSIGPGAMIEKVLVRLEEVEDGNLERTAELLSEEAERRADVQDTKGEQVKENGE